MANREWATNIRSGVVAILNNRVGMLYEILFLVLMLMHAWLLFISPHYSCRMKKIILADYLYLHLMLISFPNGIHCSSVKLAAPAEKFEALALADSVISSIGEDWLIGPVSLPEVKEPIPADRYATMVLAFLLERSFVLLTC